MCVCQGVPVPSAPVWMGKSIIRSCSNMDYATAQRIIDGRITPDMIATQVVRTFSPCGPLCLGTWPHLLSSWPRRCVGAGNVAGHHCAWCVSMGLCSLT